MVYIEKVVIQESDMPDDNIPGKPMEDEGTETPSPDGPDEKEEMGN